MQQQKAIETLKHLGAACVALAELMQGAEANTPAPKVEVLPTEKPAKKTKKNEPVESKKADDAPNLE